MKFNFAAKFTAKTTMGFKKYNRYLKKMLPKAEPVLYRNEKGWILMIALFKHHECKYDIHAYIILEEGRVIASRMTGARNIEFFRDNGFLV